MNDDLNLATPSLVFPAITLLLLAYSNRFTVLSNKLRDLLSNTRLDHPQVIVFRTRIRTVQSMMLFGVSGLILALLCMLTVFLDIQFVAKILFLTAIVSTIVSLLFTARDVLMSTAALDHELSGEYERTVK
jgi:hypothetical protein